MLNSRNLWWILCVAKISRLTEISTIALFYFCQNRKKRSVRQLSPPGTRTFGTGSAADRAAGGSAAVVKFQWDIFGGRTRMAMPDSAGDEQRFLQTACALPKGADGAKRN